MNEQTQVVSGANNRDSLASETLVEGRSCAGNPAEGQAVVEPLPGDESRPVAGSDEIIFFHSFKRITHPER